MNTKPTFTYILRRRSETENCQAQVVVIQSAKQLSAAEVRHELENTTHHPAHEFEEVHQEPDTSICLDTWEPAIEHCKPADMDFPAVKTYRDWWKAETLTPTAVF